MNPFKDPSKAPFKEPSLSDDDVFFAERFSTKSASLPISEFRIVVVKVELRIGLAVAEVLQGFVSQTRRVCINGCVKLCLPLGIKIAQQPYIVWYLGPKALIYGWLSKLWPFWVPNIVRHPFF